MNELFISQKPADTRTGSEKTNKVIHEEELICFDFMPFITHKPAPTRWEKLIARIKKAFRR